MLKIHPKLWILYFFTFLLFVCSLNAEDKKPKTLHYNQTETLSSARVDDIILFSEDWESGTIGNWITADETIVPAQWHLTDWMVYGGMGLSWHMADSTLGDNGGYNNKWYQVLDTDTFTLSGADPILTFYHRYSCESPGGEPAGYDGWDGMNVRISTDGGTTWSVLTNPTPEYTSTSLYSFGFQHGEGTGIPGWAGNLTEWTHVTFDLSAFAGQIVQLRFAFASDPAYSTDQDGGPVSLFGWQIDDILVATSTDTLFNNDGIDSTMTASSNALVGGDLWHVQHGTGSAGEYFASCNDTSNTYSPNMINSITSDWFFLDTLATNIYMDFNLQGSWDDNDVFPFIDYFGAYVQVQGENDRRYVSNITNDPRESNFVYSSAPPVWNSFSTSYSVGLIDLTLLKGKTIRIIFEFESDEDTPIADALQIDDIVVWTPAIVGVDQDKTSPLAFALEQNFPNPFNPVTNIKYTIAEAGNIKLAVYNIIGEEVKLLVNDYKEAGSYRVVFDAVDLPSGIYIYKLEMPGFVEARKMLLIK